MRGGGGEGGGGGGGSRHKNKELIDFAFLLGIKKTFCGKICCLKNATPKKSPKKSYLIGLKASLNTELHYFSPNRNLRLLGKNGSAIS